MRSYRLPTGESVPAELQEQIADDVRAFDAAQAPEARSASALRKISNELPRLRTALVGVDDERSPLARIATALEIVALGELGFTSDSIADTFPARQLMGRYGFVSPDQIHDGRTRTE
jgi:hypothetical protein